MCWDAVFVLEGQSHASAVLSLHPLQAAVQLWLIPSRGRGPHASGSRMSLGEVWSHVYVLVPA
jgi:hypothetical protein